ncbi:MAG: U32 family peptidase [Lentisphaerae bacterium]|nr:U32 family peptidase [Lentisphaerota bacterium]
MKSELFKPELLAPAGNLETAVAALSSGADAVYLGMGKFNARNRAENFRLEELSKLLNYAHSNGKKVYVTLNTLLGESELPEVMSALAQLANEDIDALIVQDLAVVYLVRKYFPQLTLHASTQMNVHNSCGIKALQMLGVKRVILERQITYSELEMIANSTTMELEVFVHGSLCLSLSGRCLLSNYFEDASGNRGMCRQLCRRNYRIDADSPVQPYLSPQDLQLMNELPKLAKLKIASLKIEGRLRGPDYVVPVVKAYRQALDQLPEIMPETLNNIQRTIARPSSSGAFYGFDKMLRREPQAVFGRNVGKVQLIDRNGLTVRLTDRIHLGDKLRLVNRSNASLAGFELTRILLKSTEITAAGAGKTVNIPGKFPYCDGEVFLYKIGENGYDFKRQAAALPPGKKGIRLDIVLDKDGLHVTLPDLSDFEFHSESFAAAERCAVSEEDLKSVFSYFNEEYRGDVNSVTIRGRWFCAKSVLKELRRELFTALLKHLPKLDKALSGSRAMHRFYRDYQAAEGIGDMALPGAAGLTVPGFIAEGDLAMWRSKISAAYQNGVRSFAVGGLHGVILLKEALKSLKDIEISAVHPMMVCNSLTVRVLKQFLIKAAEPWVELPAGELELLRSKSVLPLLEPSPVRELLVTRVPLKMKQLLDKNSNCCTVFYDRNEKLYKLCAGTPLSQKFSQDEKF